MTNWWTSAALESLRDEVNARWPGRSKASDGTIGDAAHQDRTSDHNPRPDGEVTALDITCAGIDHVWLANYLAQLGSAGDRRVKYVIHDRQISNPSISGGKWRMYTGADPHDKHVHLSVNPHAASGSWGVSTASAPTVAPAATSYPKYPGRVMKKGSKAAGVRVFQQQLKTRGWKITVDGDFGPATETVVRAFQKEKGLTVDGQVGPKTWNAFWQAPL